MRNWLHEPSTTKGKQRVVVVHCKAGKGRSGTVATSYLISEEGWSMEDALTRFTLRRMRPGFGSGVSIPSQLRWIRYVDRWTKSGKTYVERPVEIVEVHAWGIRDGVKLAVQGFIEDGRKIANAHVFKKHERTFTDAQEGDEIDGPQHVDSEDQSSTAPKTSSAFTKAFPTLVESILSTQASVKDKVEAESGGRSAIFRPENPIILPTSDICIDLERRAHAPYSWTMVTAVAHVWFNVYFEGSAPSSSESQGSGSSKEEPASSGVFEISWDAMDGLKGSSRKGTRALDKLAVVWRIPKDSTQQEVPEPAPGEPVPEPGAADWKGSEAGEAEGATPTLGLRPEDPESANVSKANSISDHGQGKRGEAGKGDDYEDSLKGVKTHGIEEAPNPAA